MPSSTHALDTAVLFYPRGGSAQVIRYLNHELATRGWRTRLHAGSLGHPGDPSHAATFYTGLALAPFDYNHAHTLFKRGENPQNAPLPFHPSYEDRGHSPDPMFAAVPPRDADHLTRTWTRHLATHRSTNPAVLHLHHLSPLQAAAQHAYPHTPRLTTLHGTELKHLDGMIQRLHLARLLNLPISQLAHQLHPDNPARTTEAHRLATTANLTPHQAALLHTTLWHQWIHARAWVERLRHAARHAGHLVVVSEHDQALATELLHLDSAPTVIGNGVDTTAFRPQPLTDQQRLAHLRHWLVTDPRGWGPGTAAGSIRYTDTDLNRLLDQQGRLRPILLWIGRFLHFKRIPVLLEAFATVLTRAEPAPVLVMWGGYPGECEGDHPADLAAKLGISDSVYFAGWRGHNELPIGLNCADLMVAPAVDEPFGMVYLEAMACGTPPLATATGGPARLITPEGQRATGWLVRPDDPAHLADTITAALTDQSARQRRSLNGRNEVESHYSWARTTDQYLNTYEQATR